MTVDAARPHQLQEPFSLKLPWRPLAAEMKAQLTFHFQGHYGEPSLNKELIIKKGVKSKDSITHIISNAFNCINSIHYTDMEHNLLLIYNPQTTEWTIETDKDAAVPSVPTSDMKKLTL